VTLDLSPLLVAKVLEIMSYSHNNQLNMVSLFDEEHSQPFNKRSYDMTRLHPNNPYHGLAGQAPAVAPIKIEEGAAPVSYTPTYDSDYVESDRDDRRPSKIPKINKDGVPRKPRQPRPKLLKWSDNDWKNVVLGIVWACGETGVQIPFDQAAQVVGESCTAGALQQAILKLRGKQIDEGYEIPSLRMAWTRKNKRASSSASSANAKPQQTTGQGQGLTTQSPPSLIVKLKAPLLTDRNCHGGVTIGKNYIAPIEPQFSMADDIHSTGGRGITVVSGLPNVPSDSGPKYPDIVKQAVPTQYKRGAGMDFDFDKHIKEMEAQNYEEDVKDHAEYDFVSNDSHEDLLASSETEQAAMSGFLPEMSSPLDHTYDSPYSFFSQASSGIHPLDPASSSQQGLQEAFPLPTHLDTGHFHDFFAHDVFPNCGYEYEFNAGH
jgi:hypothetical protein